MSDISKESLKCRFLNEVSHVENKYSDKLIHMEPTRGTVFPIWAQL